MRNEIKLTVFGKASNKIIFQKVFKKIELHRSKETLIEFLRRHQLPIASSCHYNGVCQKCTFNKNQLSCQLKISDLKNDLEMIFDYL